LTIIRIKIIVLYYQPAATENPRMYVCLCQGVTDSQIRTAINEGCCSYRDVRMALGVASQCGKCACLAKQVVRETLSDAYSSQLASAGPALFVAA